jgi:tetratricopeptide (TPR) repeat protein
MKSFFDNLFGKKSEPPKIQKRAEPVRKNEPPHEANDIYRKGDLIRGEYEVLGTLGKGGFGHVYLARHCKLGVVYALKTFRDEFLDDPKARDAFKKEALLWVNLEKHPFILSATFVLEISGRLFVFMEHIAPDAQGRVSLTDHFFQAEQELIGSLDAGDVLKWAIQFCLGMEHAGAHGIQCHRDIKPANILITKDGSLLIGDFGLSKGAEMAWRQSHSHNGSLVKGSGENSFCLMQSDGKFRSGTPGYMAPEVYRFEGADIRSDIYSFGLVLWQMASGRRMPPFMVPWHGNMESFLKDIYDQQMTGQAPRINGPLESVIERCLRPNPSERFGSFRELRKILEPIFEQTTGRKFEKPQLGKQTASFWSNKGISLTALKQYEEALDCYDKALQIDPQSSVIWDNKGNALLGLGRYEEAVGCYDKALTIVERIVSTGLSDGVYASLQCFAESRADPKAIWNNKGIALTYLGRFQDAINCYDSVLAIDPKNMATWSNKGNALKQLGQFKEAVNCYDRALAVDSRCLNALTGKATVLCELGLQKEAVSCFDEALALDPRNAIVWNDKGNALIKLGRCAEAIGCYDRALAINPQSTNVWFNKSKAILPLGRYEDGLSALDKALAIDPRNKDAWVLKGAALSDLGRVEEAIGCCDKALSIDPQNAQAWFCKGSWLGTLGRDEEAVRCCEKALSINPRNTEALFWKGSRLARLGRHEDAIRHYNEVLAVNPRNEGAWHNKALSEDILKRRHEAVNSYRKFLEFMSSQVDVKEIAFVRQRIQELERAL